MAAPACGEASVPQPATVQAGEANIALAMAVLDEHIAALNAQDNARLCATLHFPHYRLAGGRMQVWEVPDNYLADFHARAGADWHHTLWDFRNVIVAGPEKIHFDVQFTRYRADDSIIGSYRSLWIVAKLGGRWAVQARSTYAA
jgi:hypothetical protein